MRSGGIALGLFSRAVLTGTLSALVLAFGGCAARPPSSVLLPVAAPIAEIEGSKTVSVLATTTRKPSKEEDGAFTSGRARAVTYEQYAISFPPTHVPGHVEWPRQYPGDPSRELVVTEASRLDKGGFAQAIKQRLQINKDENGNVLVFIHGYNTSYQEAVLRLAQISADTSARETAVLFAWPSRATLMGYLADRESSTYSRDYLEQVLNEIAAIPNVRSINLVAHSMGNWLLLETLRQARIDGHSALFGKLGNVVMLSPDIDIDVFRTQLDTIGRLSRPIIVAVARNDRALAASQRLAGDVPRVGNVLIDDPRTKAEIERYGLQVVDLSNVQADPLGHSRFLQALPELEKIARNDDLGDGDTASSGAGIFVVGAAGGIASTPLRLTDALFGR